MEIQYGKMILHGILSIISYIVAPLVIFYLLEYFNILSVSNDFIVGILVFGIIGVVIAIFRNAYPEDSSANRFIMFIITVYSGVYLFYIFGGFTPGVELGYFSISTPQLEVTLGLKLIAWLLLTVAILNSIRYLIASIELRGKQKSAEPKKKGFRPSRIFKGLSALVSLILVGYIVSLVISGLLLSPTLGNTIIPSYDDNGTPGNFTDDGLNITLNYGIDNGGIYPLTDVHLKSEIWVISSPNASLPANTRIGESNEIIYSQIPSFDAISNQNITVIMNPTYAGFLASNDAQLGLKILVSMYFGGIFLNLTLTMSVPWTSIV